MSVINPEINNNSKDIALNGLSMAYVFNGRFVLSRFGNRIISLEDNILKLIGFPNSSRLVTEINYNVDELENEFIPKKYKKKYSISSWDEHVGMTIKTDKYFFSQKICVSMIKDNSINEYKFIRKSSEKIDAFQHNTYTYEGTVSNLVDGKSIPVLTNYEYSISKRYY